MPGLPDFRPVGAALLMLAVLAGAYEGARQLPHAPAANQPASLTSVMLTADSTAVTAGMARPVPTDSVATSGKAAATKLAPTPEAPCPTEPIRFAAGSLSERRPLRLHRYVGTIAGQPATALLQWRSPSEIEGSFYLHRGGPAYALRQQDKYWNTLRVDSMFGFGQRGVWRLASQPGTVLRGTWHNATGNHPFYFRENYTGGVRIDVRTLHLTGGRAFHERANDYDSPCSFGDYQYDYFRLPVPFAVAPAVRHALAPPLAIVQRRLRALFDEARSQSQTLTRFLLNDFNLLSYQVERTDAFVLDGGKGDFWVETYLIDLTTGRELAPASQLRPGCEQPLSRLFLQHMLHDPQFDFINKDHASTWAWQDSTYKATGQLALSKDGRLDGLFLTGSGLGTAFSSYLTEGQIGPYQDNEVIIPYRELRPLVRPGTPLARLLKARGLW